MFTNKVKNNSDKTINIMDEILIKSIKRFFFRQFYKFMHNGLMTSLFPKYQKSGHIFQNMLYFWSHLRSRNQSRQMEYDASYDPNQILITVHLIVTY